MFVQALSFFLRKLPKKIEEFVISSIFNFLLEIFMKQYTIKKSHLNNNYVNYYVGT